MRLTDRLKQLMGHELTVPDITDYTKVFMGKLVEVEADFFCIRSEQEDGREVCDQYFRVEAVCFTCGAGWGMKHHPRMCPENNLRVVTDTWLADFVECKDCGVRITRMKQNLLVRLLGSVAERLTLWMTGWVFGEAISWWKADEF